MDFEGDFLSGTEETTLETELESPRLSCLFTRRILTGTMILLSVVDTSTVDFPFPAVALQESVDVLTGPSVVSSGTQLDSFGAPVAFVDVPVSLALAGLSADIAASFSLVFLSTFSLLTVISFLDSGDNILERLLAVVFSLMEVLVLFREIISSPLPSDVARFPSLNTLSSWMLLGSEFVVSPDGCWSLCTREMALFPLTHDKLIAADLVGEKLAGLLARRRTKTFWIVDDDALLEGAAGAPLPIEFRDWDSLPDSSRFLAWDFRSSWEQISICICGGDITWPLLALCFVPGACELQAAFCFLSSAEVTPFFSNMLWRSG